MISKLEGWPTKAKKAPSPHEVRLTPLDTNQLFPHEGTPDLSMNILCVSNKLPVQRPLCSLKVKSTSQFFLHYYGYDSIRHIMFRYNKLWPNEQPNASDEKLVNTLLIDYFHYRLMIEISQ